MILLLVVAVVALAGLLGAPWAVRRYVRTKVLPRVGARLHVDVEAGPIGVGWHKVRIDDLILRRRGRRQQHPLVAIRHLTATWRWRALLRGRLSLSDVEVNRPQLHAEVDRALVRELRDLRRPSSGTGPVRSERRVDVDQVRFVEGTIDVDDPEHSVALGVKRFDGSFRPGRRSELTLNEVRISAAREHARFAARRIRIDGKLGGRGQSRPRARISDGEAQLLLPGLALSGIEGTVQARGGGEQLDIELSGSWGGAEARLWEASGSIWPAAHNGELEIKAARFNLGRIASILAQTPVIQPAKTSVDGMVRLRYESGVLAFGSDLALSDLNLFHPAVSRSPVRHLALRVSTAGSYAHGTLRLDRFDVQANGIEAHLQATVDRSAPEPKITAELHITPRPCQQVLDAIPHALVPQLAGFALEGTLNAEMSLDVDFAHLDELALRGGLDLDRCEVVGAPDAMSAERLMHPFEQIVEPAPGQLEAFIVGPENPDFTPFEQVSPHVVNALLTTEDAAFFRHHGFIRSQIAKALARNLARGGFRLGASTITMQMVKNVLLSPEKTLSRKMQELFLVWYLERELSKERLMEIYLNVIELGPGIYGIGAAARHYFGKSPSALSPLEAAFFASILPNPRGRYVQYCRGALTPRWDGYVRRILARMVSKGFVSEEEASVAKEQQLVFVRDVENLPVKECEARVEQLKSAWAEERQRRLRQAVLAAAPKRLQLYLPLPSTK